VLVVGGGGFIGGHLIRRLVESGASVSATSRPDAPRPRSPGVVWVDSDLSSPDPTLSWPSRCDSIIYLAQSRHWRRFPEGADDVFKVNVGGVFRAAEYARRVGARRFVFASSGSVYPKSGQPALEGASIQVPGERAFYPAAKLAAELLLGPYESLFAVIILRLFMPYGAGQAPEMLLPQLVGRVRADEPITLDGNDGLLANPVAASDVAATIERCLQLDAGATMNVAGPEVLTLRQIGLAIGEAVGRTPRFEMRPATEAPSVVGDTARLQAALGWAPTTRLADGLRAWLDVE
jgi:UDP-glucose 4-epimerase